MPFPTRTVTFALAGAMLLGLGWPLLRPSDTNMRRAVLQRQFKLLKAPGQAKLLYIDEKPKLGRVFIGAYYSSAMNFMQLQNHYLPQWTRNGWVRVDDTGNSALHPQRLRLCKGEYQANLEDAGAKQNIGWTYAVTFSWDAGQSCQPQS